MKLHGEFIFAALRQAGLLVETRGGAAEPFAGVTTDSRGDVRGRLFVALRGEHYDAHAFASAALDRGAAAVVVQDAATVPATSGGIVFVVRDTLQALQALAAASLRRHPVRVAAITGSNGKTTTKDLTAAALETLGRCSATHGNLNNHIGVPLTVLERAEAARFLVAEVGANHFGEIEPLSRLLAPEVAVVTNIGQAHLEAFGSLAGVVRAKAEIFAGLGADGVAVLNADDPRTPELREHLGKRRFVLFGFADNATYRVASLGEVDAGQDVGQRLTVAGTPFTLQRLGRVNAANAAAAFAVACEMGGRPEQVARALENARFTGQRSCWLRYRDVSVLDDSYNANPDSMRQAIELLGGRGKRRLAVLGDMLELGSDAESLHAALGDAIARAGVDVLFATGAYMAAAVEQARRSGLRLARHFATMQELLEALRTEVRAGDVVLVKGSRGLRMERVVAALREWSRMGA